MDRLVEVGDNDKFEDESKKVKEALEEALQFLNKSNVLVEVDFVDEEVMQNINKKTRDKNEPTNILSFENKESFPQPEDNPQRLGEIYLCPEVIKEREEDITFLAIHGLLHLLGYTHDRESDTIKMERLEDKIMKNID